MVIGMIIDWRTYECFAQIAIAFSPHIVVKIRR